MDSRHAYQELKCKVGRMVNMWGGGGRPGGWVKVCIETGYARIRMTLEMLSKDRRK